MEPDGFMMVFYKQLSALLAFFPFKMEPLSVGTVFQKQAGKLISLILEDCQSEVRLKNICVSPNLQIQFMMAINSILTVYH